MFDGLRRLFGAAAQPDGQAAAVQEEALEAGGVLAAEASKPSRRVGGRPEAVVAAALAQKTLHGWMQNRYQTRYPLVLNLRNIDPADAALVVQAIQRSLRIADPTAETARRAVNFVESIGGTLEASADDGGAELVPRLNAARLSVQAYAACAGALGRRTVVTRRYLEFLAARLDVPDDVARSINRRFAN